MKKTILTLMFLGFIFCTFSQNVKINVSKSFNANGMTIFVEGYTSQKLYLGATVIFNKKYEWMNEYDFKDVRMVKGTINEKFTIPYAYIKRVPEGVNWIVALWEKKVKNCGCEYCKKNGFHLEGRVARDTWRH